MGLNPGRRRRWRRWRQRAARSQPAWGGRSACPAARVRRWPGKLLSSSWALNISAHGQTPLHLVLVPHLPKGGKGGGGFLPPSPRSMAHPQLPPTLSSDLRQAGADNMPPGSPSARNCRRHVCVWACAGGETRGYGHRVENLGAMRFGCGGYFLVVWAILRSAALTRRAETPTGSLPDEPLMLSLSLSLSSSPSPPPFPLFFIQLSSLLSLVHRYQPTYHVFVTFENN